MSCFKSFVSQSLSCSFARCVHVQLELNLLNAAKASIVAQLINEWQTKWSSSAECASAFWREAGAEFSSPGMKAINVIERSGVSWLSYMATHGNDRQYHVTGTDYVRLQTKDRRFDSSATDRVEKHGPSPALSPSINFFLLFPCPACISSLPCSTVTSKLLFGYERLSGNRPFQPPPRPAPLGLDRCS